MLHPPRRRHFNHSFSRDILQVFNPVLLETHAQPFVLGLGMEAFLIKVNRGLVPLRGREQEVQLTMGALNGLLTLRTDQSMRAQS
jgi:hypothetical protein